MNEEMTAGKGKKILIADESQNVRDLLMTDLTVKGYQVITSRDAGETLELIRDERPDLIIMDIQMSDADGSPLCKTVKADKESKDVPIIILTAGDPKEEKSRRKECGADEYVMKPFVASELGKIIEKYLLPESAQKKMTIEQAIKKRKKEKAPYALCNFELHPEASTIYEQKYGEIRYSEMIEKVMELITGFALKQDKDMVLEQEAEDRFKLLVGGEKEKLQTAAREFQAAINSELRNFYNQDDLEQGFILRRDIVTGKEEKIPLLTIKTDIDFS